MTFSSLFELRGQLENRQRAVLEILGILFLLLLWFLLTSGASPILPPGLVPSPQKVLFGFLEMYRDNNLVQNTFRSLGINLCGYIGAVLLAVPIGFIIGLYPLFRGLFQRNVDAIRYVPLTAVTSLFLLWFGLGMEMKASFLAFGIFIYLLPTVVQRIDEVDDVYVKTVFTLGATPWQTIRSVYFPSVISRLSDDIRVLTAISWTYIIVAENWGNEGGIGSMLWKVAGRQGRVDKIFGLVLMIVLIGILQDKLFAHLDRYFFPHKYQAATQTGKLGAGKQQLASQVLDYGFQVLGWILVGLYMVLFINELTGFLAPVRLLDYLFGDSVIGVHLIMACVLFFMVRDLLVKRKSS